MNRSKLADLSEILSSAAIVITLIYLTVEVKQNTNALYAQSRQSVLSAVQTELYTMAENPRLALSVTKTTPLSPEENVKLDFFLMAAIKASEFSWLQYRDGLIDKSQWDAEVTNMAAIFDAQRTRLWWQKSGRLVFTQEFSQFMDELLKKQAATNEVWKMSANWSAQDAD